MATVESFGAGVGESASDNAIYLQDALDWLRDNGGILEFAANGVYEVDAPLTMLVNATPLKDKFREIRGNGATLDFSESGITTATVLLTIGATALAYASENTSSHLHDLIITGPEDVLAADDSNADAIQPEIHGHATPAEAYSTTTGLQMDTALNWNVENITISCCWRGFHNQKSWWGSRKNIAVRKCVIGYHVDHTSENMIHLGVKAQYCTFAFLLRPTTTSGTIGHQTFVNPVVGQSTVGFTLDQNSSSGSEIQCFHAINPYLENVYYDQFRIGFQWDADPVDAGTIGSANTGKISSFISQGGKFSGDGVTSGYSSTRKAFRFPSTPNVGSVHIIAPCVLSDIVNPPPQMTFSSNMRAEDIASQKLDNVWPGFGYAHVGSTGSLLFSRGIISSVSKVGGVNGTYDITLAKALANADYAAILVTARNAGYTAAVKDASTTTTNIRVETSDKATGTLTDVKFTIAVFGDIAAL